MPLSELDRESLENLCEAIKKYKGSLYSVWTPFEAILKRRAITSFKKDGGESFIQLVLEVLSCVEVAQTPAVVQALSTALMTEVKNIRRRMEEGGSALQRCSIAEWVMVGTPAWDQRMSELAAAILKHADGGVGPSNGGSTSSAKTVPLLYSHCLFLQQVINIDYNVNEWLHLILEDFMCILSVPPNQLSSEVTNDAWGCFPSSREKLLLSCIHWASCDARGITLLTNNRNDALNYVDNCRDEYISSSKTACYVGMLDFLRVLDHQWGMLLDQLLIVVARFIFEVLLRRKSLEHVLQSSARSSFLGNALTDYTIGDEEVLEMARICLHYVESRGREHKLDKYSEFIFLKAFSLVVCHTSFDKYGRSPCYTKLIELLLSKYAIDTSAIGKLDWRLVAFAGKVEDI